MLHGGTEHAGDAGARHFRRQLEAFHAEPAGGVQAGAALADGALERETEDLRAVHQVRVEEAVAAPTGQHQRALRLGEAFSEVRDHADVQAGDLGGGLEGPVLQLLAQQRTDGGDARGAAVRQFHVPLALDVRPIHREVGGVLGAVRTHQQGALTEIQVDPLLTGLFSQPGTGQGRIEVDPLAANPFRQPAKVFSFLALHALPHGAQDRRVTEAPRCEILFVLGAELAVAAPDVATFLLAHAFVHRQRPVPQIVPATQDRAAGASGLPSQCPPLIRQGAGIAGVSAFNTAPPARRRLLGVPHLVQVVVAGELSLLFPSG